MTAQTPTVLKTYFETRDLPNQQQFADLIDSSVNVAITSAQSIAGPLIVSANVSLGGNVTVSADSGNLLIGSPTPQQFSLSSIPVVQILGITVTAAAQGIAEYSNDANGPAIRFAKSRGTTIGSQAAVQTSDSLGMLRWGGSDGTQILDGARIDVQPTGNASTGTLGTKMFLQTRSAATGTVATGLSIDNNLCVLQTTAVISAAGTTQGAASLVSAAVCTLKGVVDGTTTGFSLRANKAGWVQYIYSDAVSANLWPPTGGTINALGANTAFPLAVNTAYTVIHIGASAYAVK